MSFKTISITDVEKNLNNEKLSKKCVNLNCAIDFNQTYRNNGIFPKYGYNNCKLLSRPK